MRNTITTSLKPVAVAALLTMGMGGIAHAGETVDLGDGLKFDWRLNANYTLGTRVKSPDALLSSATKNANGNDGTNNFKKGAITANRLAALFESKLSKGSSGLVVTASSFYDDAYQGRNDNNGASTKISKFAVGYVYNLSKRTALYSTVARLSNSNGTTVGIGGNTGGTAAPSPVAGGKSMAAEVGLRHFF